MLCLCVRAPVVFPLTIRQADKGSQNQCGGAQHRRVEFSAAREQRSRFQGGQLLYRMKRVPTMKPKLEGNADRFCAFTRAPALKRGKRLMADSCAAWGRCNKILVRTPRAVNVETVSPL